MDARAVFEWLVDGAPGAEGAPEVVARMCEDLVASGIPLDRFAAFVRTLHPQFMGRAFYWNPGKPVEVKAAPYARRKDIGFTKSIVAAVQDAPIRRRIMDLPAPRDYIPLDELANEGFTDYLAAPMTFMDGQRHVVTFGTKHPGGFNEKHVQALLQVVRPLSRVAEILAQRRNAATLLDTYVGRNAGERIVAGKIKRGDLDMIRAVIWFSDLRGFTALASSLSPEVLIGVLNDVFDCQVPAIEHHGGEVLKFMGDGLLAIFPTEGTSESLGAICDKAFDAAAETLGALAKLNETRATAGHERVRLGLALHMGDVAYGNIGGAARLDFTCIGPAVNVASRLEGITVKVDRPVVASADVARLTTRKMTPLGAFELKGVAGPQDVYAPTDALLATW